TWLRIYSARPGCRTGRCIRAGTRVPAAQRRRWHSMSDNTETATVAGGCFWPAEELLHRRPGVLSTRVGYTGGVNDNATVEDHPGHAEAVEIGFDAKVTAYRDILEYFMQIHRADLAAELVGSDYRSEIFYRSDEQRDTALEVIGDVDASGMWPGKVVT